MLELSRVSYRDCVKAMRPQCVRISNSEHHFLKRCVSKRAGNATVTSTCQWGGSSAPNQAARHSTSLPERIHALTINVLQKTPGSSARLRGLGGVVVSVAIAGIAIYALTHALRHVDYDEVFAIVARTNAGLIALALMLVTISYGSLTVYDLLALRTIGRPDVPYR